MARLTDMTGRLKARMLRYRKINFSYLEVENVFWAKICASFFSTNIVYSNKNLGSHQ
jgi:hypothetical protein